MQTSMIHSTLPHLPDFKKEFRPLLNIIRRSLLRNPRDHELCFCASVGVAHALTDAFVTNDDYNRLTKFQPIVININAAYQLQRRIRDCYERRPCYAIMLPRLNTRLN